MEETSYTASIVWLMVWPFVIWLGYRFVRLNMKHFAKLERLEELEAKCGTVHEREL